MKHIRIYKTSDGKEPFNTWLESIKDKITKARICRRIDRLYLGNECDHKCLSRNSKGNPRFRRGSNEAQYIIRWFLKR